MSHFSKIKTNISNFKMLKKTLKDLGFNYYLNNFKNSISLNDKTLIIFKNDIKNEPLFKFIWNGKEFILIADLFLWNLDISLEYFLEKLSQQYAYNIVLNESLINGFNHKVQTITSDGSIKLVVEKWNHNLS